MSERGIQAARHISLRLQPYCTVLLKLFLDPNGRERALQVGSGTFIRVGPTHGILTPFHCTVPLHGEYLLGLSAAPEANAHNFTLHPGTLSISSIATPFSDERGPDLAFITIADWSKIETIKASKSFYDLQAEKDKMLNHPPPPDRSLWYLCGVPNERLEMISPEAGFDTMFQFQSLCGVGGIDRTFERDGYDYAEMDVLPAPDDPPPASFEGMSGGGLWQVPVGPATDAAFAALDHYFAGVIYYQGLPQLRPDSSAVTSARASTAQSLTHCHRSAPNNSLEPTRDRRAKLEAGLADVPTTRT